MFGVGFSELIVIMVVILIVFGPEKLPEAANQFGKIMGMLKRNSDALRREFYNSVYTPVEDMKSRIDLSARELVGLDPKDPSQMNCEEKARWSEEQAKKAEEEAKQIPETKETAHDEPK